MYRILQSLFKQLIFVIPIFYFSHTLNVDDFGSIAYELGIVSIFIMLADFGISAIIVREYSNRELNVNDILSIIIFGTLFTFLFSIIIVSFTDVTGYFIVALIASLHYFYIVIDSCCRAKEKFNIMFFLTLLSFSLYLCVFFLLKINCLYYILSYYLFFLFFTLIYFYKIGYVFFDGVDVNVSIYFDLLKKSIWIFFASLSFIFIFRVDLLFINKYLTLSDVGYYEYADKLFNLFVYSLVVIIQVISVKFIKSGELKTKENIKNHLYFILLFVFALCITYYYLFNVSFIKNDIPSDVILLSSIILFFRSINVLFIQAFAFSFSYEKIVVIVNIIAGVVNCSLNYFLIYNGYSLNGVLLATLIANIVSSFLFVIFLYKKGVL